MKIAVFHNLGAGGAKRQLYEQAKALTARGHVLDLFVTGGAEDSEEFLPLAPLCHSVYTYGPPGAKTAVPAATKATKAALSSRGNLRQTLLQSSVGHWVAEWVWVRRTAHEITALTAAHRAIAHDIERGNYAAAYICQCRKMLAPELLRFLTRTPTVFCCNDTLRAAFEWLPVTVPEYDDTPETPLRRKRQGRFFSPAQDRFSRREERRFIDNARRADRVLANSRYTAERLTCVAGINARLCRPGVDSAFYCPDSTVPRDTRLVVSVGALLPSKCHEFVLRSVATLPAAVRPQLEIIGYESRYGEEELGPEGQRLSTLAEKLGVTLTIRKEVTDEAVCNAYRRAGVVAFAPYLEPLGIVPLEAGACAAPVVGVAEAGIRETIRDHETGLLTERDPHAFGETLRRVLDNHDFALRLGTRGRELVLRDWTWQQSADTLERILSETAAGGMVIGAV